MQLRETCEACRLERVAVTDLAADVMDAVKALNRADYASATAYDLERATLALSQASGRLRFHLGRIAEWRELERRTIAVDLADGLDRSGATTGGSCDRCARAIPADAERRPVGAESPSSAEEADS